MHSRPILIVDGLNCFFRHFVANPSLSENGDPVGGVVGFLKGLQLLLERYNPSKVVVAWEGGGSPRRRSIDPNYKMGRRPEKLNRFYSDDLPDTVSNRNEQLAKLVKILRHTPVLQFYVSDCEADDIIARLVNVNFDDENCMIVSTDKDLYQLVTERVKQWSPGQKAELNIDIIQDKFGIHPNNFCVARCFIGDGSDGLKGVPGAGFKAMAKRFPELKTSSFVSVEDILTLSRERREQKRLKLYDNIISEEKVVKKNWKLMYLGNGNLSASHIKKIDDIVDAFSPKRDKLGFMRCLIQLCIKNFDTDKLFMTFKALN